MSWWDEYSTYLKSDKWKRKKEKYFALYGKRCAICRSGMKVQIHHMSYQHMGNEPLSDLVALCAVHHKKLTIESRIPYNKRMFSLDEFTKFFIKREKKKLNKGI